METVLGIYLRFARWQGGTMHQAIENFKPRPMTEKDAFCSRVLHALDSKNLEDIENAAPFFNARTL